MQNSYRSVCRIVAAVIVAAVLATVAVAILPVTVLVFVAALVLLMTMAQTVPRVLGYGRRHRQQANSSGDGSITRIARRLLVLGITLRVRIAGAAHIMYRWRPPWTTLYGI